ncbi:MAG TPA: K(+)-transporting ATPase subunit F [Chloroflexota bacterium]|nr:K(+)-transporting ATPase subunit F [Chloroflexota bacterium]
MAFDNALGLAVVVLVAGYLLYALLRPERF